MSSGKADPPAITGEARVKMEGGLAYFPGLAKPHVVSFDDLSPEQTGQISQLADEADFFGCTMQAPSPSVRDGRTYVMCLRIGEREREVCVSDPISNPAMAELIAVVRRLPGRSDG